MSYATRVDDMIASHVARFQAELALAKIMEKQPKREPMPHGYLRSIYHPSHYIDAPPVTDGLPKSFVHSGSLMTNGVPWLLGMELCNGYVLGAYNPSNPPCDRDNTRH